MHFRGDSSKNRRTERTALVRGNNLQRAIQHVAAGLHNDLVFPRDAAQRHHVIDGDPLIGKALHDCACAKGGGSNQTAEQQRSVGSEVQIGNNPFQALVSVRCAAAVKPVEHHRQVIQRRILSPCFGQRRKQLFLAGVDLLFQFRMLGGKLFQRPAEYASKPGVDIPKRRLACFQTDKSRHHAAINLTANTFHCPLANALFVGDQNVAGRSTNNFYQCVRLCACANCAHMAVKRAAGNHHAFRQAETLRPFRA